MKKPTLYVALYDNGDDANFYIFVAPEECDYEKEFKHAFKQEEGHEFPPCFSLYGVYPIGEAFDYRAKDSGWYNIKLIKE